MCFFLPAIGPGPVDQVTGIGQMEHNCAHVLHFHAHTHTHIYTIYMYIRMFHPVKRDALWAELLISEQIFINMHIVGNRIWLWIKLLIKVLIRVSGEVGGSASRLPGWGDCAAKMARFRPKRRHCGRRRR